MRPDCGSCLEQRGQGQQGQQAETLDLLEDSMVDTRPKPQPFSQHRSMFSTGSMDGKVCVGAEGRMGDSVM